MNGLNPTLIITLTNVFLTVVSVICAIVSVWQTRKQNKLMFQQIEVAYQQIKETSKQTEIAQKQLEESCKPDYPTTVRLESIAHSIQRLDGTVKDLGNNK